MCIILLYLVLFHVHVCEWMKMCGIMLYEELRGWGKKKHLKEDKEKKQEKHLRNLSVKAYFQKAMKGFKSLWEIMY